MQWCGSLSSSLFVALLVDDGVLCIFVLFKSEPRNCMRCWLCAGADGLQPRRQSGDGTVWVHVRSLAPVEKGSNDVQEPLLPSSRVSSPWQP